MVQSSHWFSLRNGWTISKRRGLAWDREKMQQGAEQLKCVQAWDAFIAVNIPLDRTFLRVVLA
jgi:hypothetical protein